MLGHEILVTSTPGKGSRFAIEISLSPDFVVPNAGHQQPETAMEPGHNVHREGSIIVVEDDSDVRKALALLLEDDGHSVLAVATGVGVPHAVEGWGRRPDILLTDYSLPGGLSGLQLDNLLRNCLPEPFQTIMLTGDISTDAQEEISRLDCLQLNKPTGSADLLRAIQEALERQRRMPEAAPSRTAPATTKPPSSVVFVVDDDDSVRLAIRALLEENGCTVRDFSSCEDFLEVYSEGSGSCLLIDANLPGMTGLQLLGRLYDRGDRLPAIMITGNGEVSLAVEAMKAGAVDFIEKPIAHGVLLESIVHALERPHDVDKLLASRNEAAAHLASLTPRQRQIMTMVLAGQPSKNIAADLGVSQRTVENHRASIMKRTGSKSLPALARLAVAAAWDSFGDQAQ
ncbi:MAG: response regulator [Devosia sp.]